MLKSQTALIAGGIIIVAALMTRKGASAAGEAVGGAIVSGGTGIVFGIADGLGVPRTDEQKAAEARARGDIWDASFYMPAGEFVGWLWDGAPTGGATGSW